MLKRSSFLSDRFKFSSFHAGIEHHAKVRLYGGDNLRPVGHDAEHVGDVTALGKSLVVKRSHFRRDFAAVEAGDLGHRACSSSKSTILRS
jgi:hypothetical protein